MKHSLIGPWKIGNNSKEDKLCHELDGILWSVIARIPYGRAPIYTFLQVAEEWSTILSEYLPGGHSESFNNGT